MIKKALALAFLCSLLMGATWTWPGHLGTHLRNHGFTSSEVRGMSHYQQRAVHDRIHNTVRRGYPRRSDANLIRGRSFNPYSRANHSTHRHNHVCPHCGRVH